eukprot:TRINITY_DN17595_c0_g1_i1.p2 TRINITY_DN17595_c0_g1~~TRINITY_DN17595_c0_g1_i1.p2  ORF type:complete len:109 (+),score=28.89 TRINITY_DN17595_c0_g1_i1:1835-2161(+)
MVRPDVILAAATVLWKGIRDCTLSIPERHRLENLRVGGSVDLELVVVVVLAEGERRGDEDGPDSWRNEDRVLFDFMADLREEMQVLLMSLWLQVSAAAMREWEREREE